MEHDQLVRLCQTGDENALAELYRRYAPAAFKTAYLMVGDRPLAEDVVQETFIQVMRRISTLREASSLRAWIYQILSREAKAIARKASWTRWLPFDLPGFERADQGSSKAFEHLEAEEEITALRTAIKLLKPDHRVPLVLFYYTGLGEQEIAEIVGCPVGTVKSRLFYARKELHGALATARGQQTPAQVKQQVRRGESNG